MGLKLEDRLEGDWLCVAVSGELLAGGCAHLERFFGRRVAGQPRVRMELLDLDSADAPGIAVLSRLLEQARDRGTSFELHHAPQMVAHNLYKAGLLGDGRIRLVAPRIEEPYG